jgi:hypothetical protein
MNSFKFILIIFVSFLGVTQINATKSPNPAINYFKKMVAPQNVYSISGSVFGFVTPREPASVFVQVGGVTVVNQTFGNRFGGFSLNINGAPGTVCTITTVDFRVFVNGTQVNATNGTTTYTLP